MSGALVQLAQRLADDAVADAGEPAGALGVGRVHAQAQHFDEQHLGQLGEHAGAAGAR
jgi:hypothetical protein